MKYWWQVDEITEQRTFAKKHEKSLEICLPLTLFHTIIERHEFRHCFGNAIGKVKLTDLAFDINAIWASTSRRCKYVSEYKHFSSRYVWLQATTAKNAFMHGDYSTENSIKWQDNSNWSPQYSLGMVCKGESLVALDRWRMPCVGSEGPITRVRHAWSSLGYTVAGILRIQISVSS